MKQGSEALKQDSALGSVGSRKDSSLSVSGPDSPLGQEEPKLIISSHSLFKSRI